MIIDNLKYKFQSKRHCEEERRSNLFRGLGVFVALLLLSLTSRAQYVNNGTDPASATWSHVTNQHFDVIFPDSIRAQGEHFMRLLNKVYVPTSADMNYQPRRIPVIMHPYNLQSNGMVVWAPSRMEIITTAPSDGYGQPWLEQLALHEFRHVVQTDMMNRGFTHGLYYLLGEQAVAFPSALIQPWVFEGDAVGNETALSYTGRGRMPSFSMGLRTISLSRQKYSYDKYMLGSYRDYIPNRYEYGYQMTSYGKYKYGADLWGKVYRYTGNYPFLIFTQSLATKKYTGKNSINFHKEAKLFLDSMWQAQLPRHTDNPQPLAKDKKFSCDNFVDYSGLTILDDGSMFAVRSTLSRTPMLVRIEPDATTKKVAMLGSMSSQLAGGKTAIFWTEYSPDLRWEQKNFSELWRYSSLRNKVELLTDRTSYFTPAVSDEGRVVVCEKFVSGEQAVVLLNSKYEKSEEILHLTLGTSVNDLTWVDTENLAVLLTSAQGVSIEVVNVRTKNVENLLPHTYAEVLSLYAEGGKIFFSTGYDGVSNIYALDAKSKEVHKLTHARYGAFDPQLSADSASLLYITYDVKGGKPVTQSMDSLRWEATAFDAPYQLPLAEAIAEQEHWVLDTAKLDTTPLEVKKYSKLAHLFRLHSWAPFSFSSSELMSGDFSSMAVGVTLMSQNNLSSMVTSLGYAYQNGFNSVNASVNYTGFYPVFSLSGSYGTRYQRVYDYAQRTYYESDNYYGELRAIAYVPLNFSYENLIISLVPSLQYSLYSDRYRFDADEDFRYEQAVSVGISHSLYTRMAVRDINPRWGYRISASVLSAPFINISNKTNGVAQQSTIQANVYLPGVLCNHSVKLYGGIEYQRWPPMYATRLQLPRGGAPELDGWAFGNAVSLSANYALPLWYPDLSLGLPAYIKRIRTNIFYDAFLFDSYNKHVNSAGYEAIFDANILRFSSFTASLGWRQSFVNSSYEGKYNKVEFLLSINY